MGVFLPLRAHAADVAMCVSCAQGIEADVLGDVVARCASESERDASIAKRAIYACASYLWLVHGVDYFAGAREQQA